MTTLTTGPRPESRIEVHADAAELATIVAGELVSRLADAQQAGRVPHIALTGGTIAEKIHREVARLGRDSDVDWTQVVVWWGDERFVAPDSPDRNALDARTAFLDVVGVPAENIHEVPSTAEADSPDAAADLYAAALREHGAEEFEVLMLGVGPDGHVASLFPGSAQLDVDDRIAVGVTDSPKPPPERVSLTLGALCRSKAVWFVASGESKADAVARALSPGADPHDVPAAGPSGTQETLWFLDRESASRI